MQTSLYQLELDYTNIDCGMSYIFHLQDGRFFIIDGGYFTPGEEDRLYDFLKERCEGMPVIAGWFFSHAHQDHVGNFIQFIWKYREQVVIENLIYNFQPIDLSDVKGDWKSSDPATVKEFYGTVGKYCGDIPKITPHTGDVFQIGEITVETLHTHEDNPAALIFNDNSTVITTQIASQKILWLGDIEKEGSRILMQDKKDKLPCDIVQISHHGYSGATHEVYAATQAKTALWPTPDYIMEAIRSNNPYIKTNHVNLFVLNDMNVQEHFVGGDGTVKMALPYRIGTADTYPKRFFGSHEKWK
jgi:beta-lactamase superfamily II metal-dependent hydrolase